MFMLILIFASLMSQKAPKKKEKKKKIPSKHFIVFSTEPGSIITLFRPDSSLETVRLRL